VDQHLGGEVGQKRGALLIEDPWARQGREEGIHGHRPSSLGVVLGSGGLGLQWPEQQYVVESDDVLQHPSGVPFGAR